MAYARGRRGEKKGSKGSDEGKEVEICDYEKGTEENVNSKGVAAAREATKFPHQGKIIAFNGLVNICRFLSFLSHLFFFYGFNDKMRSFFLLE